MWRSLRSRTTFDFWMGGLRTQAKTEQESRIQLIHRVKGTRNCACSDPIDQFLFGSTWKSNGAYWVIYTTLPMWLELGVALQAAAHGLL